MNKNKKKILVISPTPTHPQNAGNRARIFSFCELIRGFGHDLHFLYSEQEKYDPCAMKEYWGDKLYTVPYDWKKYGMKKKKDITKSSGIRKRFEDWLYPNREYLSEVDDHFNMEMYDFIRENKLNEGFDIVLIEYIFQSKAFELFPDSTVKILDTHDIMTNRHKMFLKIGKEPHWYSTSKKEEAVALNRADEIIAIQEHEKKFFRKLTKNEIVTIGHPVELHRRKISGKPRKKLLFIGSVNMINLYSIQDFLDDKFPYLKEKIPGLELLIAGKVCNELEGRAGVKLLGEIENIDNAYAMSDIVINPLTFGTGLKIKMIEALGYSKAVITTKAGAQGLESGIGESFLQADTKEEYLQQINSLLQNGELYAGICENAVNFAEKENEKNIEELKGLIEGKE